jgi:hypothetical protein
MAFPAGFWLFAQWIGLKSIAGVNLALLGVNSFTALIGMISSPSRIVFSKSRRCCYGEDPIFCLDMHHLQAQK